MRPPRRDNPIARAGSRTKATQVKQTLFVSTEWLADRLGSADLAIVDGSFFMPAEQRDARAEFAAGHVPGAVFFDIDTIAERSNSLPHMLSVAK